MYIEDLSVLQAIVAAGSIRKAAVNLGMAQPTLTRTVRRLERELHVELLARSTRGVKLTPIGRDLLPYVEEILLANRWMHEHAQAHLDSNSVTLRLGCSSGLTRHKLLAVIGSMGRTHPGLNIDITEGGSIQIMELIDRGSLDIGLVVRSPLTREVPPGVACEDLMQTRLMACVPSSHPWARSDREHSIAELASQPLIMPRRGYLMWDVITGTFDPSEVNVLFHTQDAAAARRLVAEGLGITLATDLTVGSEPALPGMKAVPLKGDGVIAHVSLLNKRNRPIGKAARVFMDLVRAQA